MQKDFFCILASKSTDCDSSINMYLFLCKTLKPVSIHLSLRQDHFSYQQAHKMIEYFFLAVLTQKQTFVNMKQYRSSKADLCCLPSDLVYIIQWTAGLVSHSSHHYKIGVRLKINTEFLQRPLLTSKHQNTGGRGSKTQNCFLNFLSTSHVNILQ